MRQALLILLLLVINALSYSQEISSEINRAFLHRDMSLLPKSHVECRLVPMGKQLATEFFYDGDWHLYEWDADTVYLTLDNQTVANVDDITLDPFLVLRTKVSRHDAEMNVINSWSHFAHYDAIHPETYAPQAVNIEELSLKAQESKRLFQSRKEITIKNSDHVFSDSEPYFLVQTDANTCEEIAWQISDKPFESDSSRPLCANFEALQKYAPKVTLDSLSATFINPRQQYYFRVKAKHEGNWTAWSDSFAFSVHKPDAVREAAYEVDPDFQDVITWESDNPEGTRYYVFASNAIDFIPSIYFDKQINAIKDGEIVDAEDNQNLLTITTEKSIRIDNQYAYYRVIAERNGMFSVPSPIIRYFEDDTVLPRNVLQQSESKSARRVSYPAPYSSISKKFEDPLEAVSRKMFGSERVVRPEGVSNDVWNHVQPYLIPDNHPMKEKLDRIFGKTRASHSTKTLELAGFTDIKKGPWSHATICKHYKLKGYLVKLFRDEQKGLSDWKQWVRRASGSKCVRDSIARHHWGRMMKAPRKWIYPLPSNPPAQSGVEKKNFILIVEDMKIISSKDNRALWKSKEITHGLLEAIFTLITEEGLSDTVQAFNMPFSKDGRISLIDLEHHHEWPVPYGVLLRYLNSSNARYWEHLIRTRGKD